MKKIMPPKMNLNLNVTRTTNEESARSLISRAALNFTRGKFRRGDNVGHAQKVLHYRTLECELNSAISTAIKRRRE